MAVCYLLEWQGVGQSEYDAVLAEVGLERFHGPAADGGVSHVAGPVDGGWLVADIWESDEAFQAFLADRLGPASASVGIPQPSVRTFPVYDYFTGSGTVR